MQKPVEQIRKAIETAVHEVLDRGCVGSWLAFDPDDDGEYEVHWNEDGEGTCEISEEPAYEDGPVAERKIRLRVRVEVVSDETKYDQR